jgi:hypothetical protein
MNILPTFFLESLVILNLLDTKMFSPISQSLFIQIITMVVD